MNEIIEQIEIRIGHIYRTLDDIRPMMHGLVAAVSGAPAIHTELVQSLQSILDDLRERNSDAVCVIVELEQVLEQLPI